MTELESLGAIYWGQTWLDALRESAGLDADALDTGASYARHDVELEVFIDKGRLEATAGSGRRLTYDVVVSIPVLPDEAWRKIFERIASTSARTAAVLDGVAEPILLADAKAAGVDLMPTRDDLTWECGCALLRRRDDTDATSTLCKHVGAVLYLLADTFDEDPFDLLLLRGRSRDEIRTAVGELRTGPSRVVEESADAVWTRVRGPLPEVPGPPAEPEPLTPWATEPPAAAPFSAEGLQTIGTETASRAHHLLTDPDAHDYLDLEPMADLARRAAMVEGTPRWRTLVRRSGLTAQELTARAAAWRVAGTAGVQVQMSSRNQRRVSGIAQVRQSHQGPWFRFEKKSGRWTLTAGPADDPNDLLLDVDITPVTSKDMKETGGTRP